MITDRARHEVARVPCDPALARVYGEGWQSWSATEVVPATAPPAAVTAPASLVIDFQYASPPPSGTHQGSGLLAVDPGPGEPVHVFAAPGASRSVPVIQASLRNGHLVVTADGPVGHTTDPGPGGLTGALARWADGFAARAGATPARLRPVPPVWCSWYQYYDSVTEADIVANLAAMDELGLGFGVVQIDDGYQAAPGDWLVPSGRFASLPGLVRRIRDTGGGPGSGSRPPCSAGAAGPCASTRSGRCGTRRPPSRCRPAAWCGRNARRLTSPIRGPRTTCGA